MMKSAENIDRHMVLHLLVDKNLLKRAKEDHFVVILTTRVIKSKIVIQ